MKKLAFSVFLVLSVFLSSCLTPLTTTTGALLGGGLGGGRGALIGAGAGMAVGGMADYLIYGKETFRPQPAYARSRHYSFGMNCGDAPTDEARRRCEIGAERGAQEAQRESMRQWERFGYELGRGRY